eukprot:g1982.t1
MADTVTETQKEFIAICKKGDLGAAKKMLSFASESPASGFADACIQDPSDGMSPLMAAASAGSTEVVSLLLQHGAPWNALDRKGRCAGEYAMEAGHQKVVDQLVDAGVRAEMILAALDEKKRRGMMTRPPPSNRQYLERDISYLSDGDTIVDKEKDAVMMAWEKPLMELHAEVACATKGHVLNIGFGLGLVDTAIQKRKPSAHTIIEAHPQVYRGMIKAGWDKKEGVNVVFGRWQDVISKLGPFDAIFFDTYGEYYADMRELHVQLPKLLKPGGLYSFFNGLCPHNVFFQGVMCQIVKLELAELGLSTQFIPVPVNSSPDSDTWKGVKRKYFHNDTYFLPICHFGNVAPRDCDGRDRSEKMPSEADSSAMEKGNSTAPSNAE